MCDALRELMKEDLDEREFKTKLEAVQKIMKSLKFTAEQAMDVLEIAPEQRAMFMTKL